MKITDLVISIVGEPAEVNHANGPRVELESDGYVVPVVNLLDLGDLRIGCGVHLIQREIFCFILVDFNLHTSLSTGEKTKIITEKKLWF